MAQFLMPILGADMTEGKLVAWRKQPGDRIERGEIIAEVETDKADVEVECYVPGVLEELLAAEGSTVLVGTPIALIKADDEAAAAAQVEPVAPPPSVEAAAAAAHVAPARPQPPVERVRASPAARQLAEASGIDLGAISGTGPGGRITREDVEKAVAVGASSGAAPEDDRNLRMRQAIAAAMSRSARDIPHFHLTREIDLKAALDWLTETNGQRPVASRLLYVVLLIKAVALALREAPDLNAEWQDGRIERKPDINVGMAISLRGGGLVAPALLKADERTVDDLMSGFRDLVQRARSGKLLGSELTGGTITITNLGELGADSVYGIIYPHQVALVGFGRITEQARVVDGLIGPRPVIVATLSADHRVVDGHLGSTFLAVLDRLLQEPEKL
jgi:Pyruvate/2-oxoglutarate dehydrogenase complex, dihydrolipoamide acyltransferase (E2) component, and related enzymes